MEVDAVRPSDGLVRGRVSKRAVGLAFLAAVYLVGCSSSSSVPGRGTVPHPSLQVATDSKTLKLVRITSCAADSREHVVITGSVHNTTSVPHDYVIQLSITDRDGKALAATAAAAKNVPPGKRSPWHAATTVTFTAGTRCQVTGLSTS